MAERTVFRGTRINVLAIPQDVPKGRSCAAQRRLPELTKKSLASMSVSSTAVKRYRSLPRADFPNTARSHQSRGAIRAVPRGSAGAHSPSLRANVPNLTNGRRTTGKNIVAVLISNGN